ncbi:MAG: Ger(x)C family spore germination C-terminal domain-containing protein [Anaerotignum faecicola]
MYKKFVLLALAVPFFLTGCWDKKDPEDRAFIITLGVDTAAENGCHFTFAPANIETGEAEIYAAESETLSGAVAQVDTYTSRKTDLGQLKTVILGEGLLRDSARLDALLGELERSQVVSEKVMLLAADSAAACVEKAMKEDSKTGLFLWDFIKYRRGGGGHEGIDLDTFLTERTERGMASRIRAEGKAGHYSMAVSARGASILNEEEERGYLFLLGDAEGAVLEGRYKAAVLPLAVTKTKADYDFQAAGDTVLCTVTLPVEGTLQGGRGELLSAEQKTELESIFSASIKEEVEHTIKTALSEGVDFLGILPRAERALPQLAKACTREQLWERMAFRVVPKVQITDMGRKR